MAERFGQYIRRVPGELLRGAAGLSDQSNGNDLRRDFMIPEARQFGRDLAGLDDTLDVPVSSEPFPNPLAPPTPFIPVGPSAVPPVNTLPAERPAAPVTVRPTGSPNIGVDTSLTDGGTSLLARHAGDDAAARRGVFSRAASQSMPDLPDLSRYDSGSLRSDPTGHDFSYRPPSQNRLQALSAAQMGQDFGVQELMNLRHEQAMAGIDRAEERNDPMRRQIEAAARNAAYEDLTSYGGGRRPLYSSGEEGGAFTRSGNSYSSNDEPRGPRGSERRRLEHAAAEAEIQAQRGGLEARLKDDAKYGPYEKLVDEDAQKQIAQLRQMPAASEVARRAAEENILDEARQKKLAFRQMGVAGNFPPAGTEYR